MTRASVRSSSACQPRVRRNPPYLPGAKSVDLAVACHRSARTRSAQRSATCIRAHRGKEVFSRVKLVRRAPLRGVGQRLCCSSPPGGRAHREIRRLCILVGRLSEPYLAQRPRTSAPWSRQSKPRSAAPIGWRSRSRSESEPRTSPRRATPGAPRSHQVRIDRDSLSPRGGGATEGRSRGPPSSSAAFLPRRRYSSW